MLSIIITKYILYFAELFIKVGSPAIYKHNKPITIPNAIAIITPNSK